MFSALLSLLVCLALSNSGPDTDFTPEKYKALYDSIKALDLDFDHAANLSNLQFGWDAARFNFLSGQGITLAQAAGKTFGLYFEGKGEISLQAPTPVEKFSIKKFTKHEDFQFQFEEALLVFSPELFDSLFPRLKLEAGKQSDRTESHARHIKDRLLDFGYDLPAETMPKLINQAESPFLMAFVTDGSKDYVYLYDPCSAETVQLYRITDRVGYEMLDVVASFYPKSYYDTGGQMCDRDWTDYALPLSYDIRTAIDKGANVTAECNLNITVNRDGLSRAYFVHSGDLKIDSVKTSQKENLFFKQLKDKSSTSVFFKQPLKRGDTTTLVFYYHSKKIIEKSSWGDFFLLAPQGWYPSLGYLSPARYKLSFKSPEWLKFLSIGEKTIDSVSGDYRYTEWVRSDPVLMAGFNYGWFDSLILREPGLPTVKVFRSNPGHEGRLFGANMLEVTGKDVLAALEFFGKTFCPYQYDQLLVTEIPMDHGQCFPGLLHLGWSSFENDQTGDEFNTDDFRAHEVAHLWWGHIMGWKSYHDQWLSEGFANYSGAWFVQAKDGNNKRFLKILDDWHDIITQKGGGTGANWVEGSEAGPIWLGYRLSSSKSSDYSTLVYAKGAYVLHMIRMLLFDYNAKSDARFIDLMQDFVNTFKNRKASTLDFQKIVEKHVGKDMSWFFNEWVFGTEIPTYRLQFETIEENGKYCVKVTVKQEKVSDGFKMLVPLVVDMENNSYMVLRFWVEGPLTEYTSPPLPSKPKRYIFNPYREVLCNVK